MAQYSSKKEVQQALRVARMEYASSRQVVRQAIKNKLGKVAITEAEEIRDKKLKRCVELQTILDHWY